jgi:hypothetical protein
VQGLRIEWLQAPFHSRHPLDAKFAHITGSSVPGHILHHTYLTRLVTRVIATAHLLLPKNPGADPCPDSPKRQINKECFIELRPAGRLLAGYPLGHLVPVKDHPGFVNVDGCAAEGAGQENLTLIWMQLPAALGTGQNVCRQLVLHKAGL